VKRLVQLVLLVLGVSAVAAVVVFVALRQKPMEVVRGTPPGIGVRRAAVRSVLEARGLRFSPGAEQLMGNTDDRLVAVQLLGPEEDLAEVGVLLARPPSVAGVARQSELAVAAVMAATPGWPDAPTWVLKALSAEGPSTTQRAPIELSVEPPNAAGLASVTIRRMH
jgi:hypothetical protein